MTIPDTCVQLLSQMVAIDTVNGNISGRSHPELELVVYLESVAEAMGLQSRRMPVGEEDCNLVVWGETNTNASWLLFDSHLDTVGIDGMTVDPFGGVVKNGKMYGRGACDTKATGATMLSALKMYAQQERQPNNIAVVFTSNEEYSKTGAQALAATHLSELGWQPIGIVVGEPTGMQMTVAHNGVVRWSITTHGRAAHSSDPSAGKSAISMMLRVVDAIESRYIPGLSASHPLTGKAQSSVNVIHGGTQFNIIPEQCLIQVDRRVVPGESVNEVDQVMRAFISELAEHDAALEVSVETQLLDPPMDPAGHEKFHSDICESVATIGTRPEQIGVGYGTNASTYTDVGIPAVVFGPGDIKQAHTADEWIEVDQLEPAVNAYLSMMQYGY